MYSVFILTFFCAFQTFQAQLYYEDQDNVNVFNQEKFESVFNNRLKVNWIFQFYNLYCGHCIGFAPHFKKFLKEAQYWSWLVKFGVLDCNSESDFCNEMGVGYYPYFKIYPKRNHNVSGLSGSVITFDHKNSDEIFNNLVGIIDQYLNPSEFNLNRKISSSMKKPYLIIQGSDDLQLKRTILTYKKRLRIKNFYQLNNDISGFVMRLVTSRGNFRKDLGDLNELYVELNDILTNKSEAVYSEGGNNSETTISTKDPSPVPLDIHYQDIHASVMYALTQDVSESKLNTSANVQILRLFIEKLYYYLGLDDTYLDGFRYLVYYLSKKAKDLDNGQPGIKWQTILDNSGLPELKKEWISCNGSKPQLRRYPCGMWTAFHIMTINQYQQGDTGDKPSDLIKAIRDFQFHFFSCHECGVNFLSETKGFEDKIANAYDVVLYLWGVHNKVNKRLSNEPSDDPEHSKVSFPSYSACPSCGKPNDDKWPENITWNYDNVFNYLVEHYTHLVI